MPMKDKVRNCEGWLKELKLLHLEEKACRCHETQVAFM